ncbi:hypothetical protein GCM10027443_03240 [Pontibacter brevis]
MYLFYNGTKLCKVFLLKEFMLTIIFGYNQVAEYYNLKAIEQLLSYIKYMTNNNL